jgi:hypothetical protein
MNVFHPLRKKTSVSFVKIHKRFSIDEGLQTKKMVDNFDPTALFVIG